MSANLPVEGPPESRRWGPAGLSRRLALACVAILVMLSLGATWITLEQIERRTRANTGDSLRIVARTTHESLQAWLQGEQEYAKRLFHHPRILELTQRLVSGPRTSSALLSSDAFVALRKQFEGIIETHGEIGVFVISRDLVNVFSMRDENVGDRNLIAEQRPDLIRRAFSGETVSRLGESFERGISDGWICHHGKDPVRFSRIAKPDGPNQPFSIDAVLMEGPGPKHRHPLGEISICYPVAGDPSFDGKPPGWVVKAVDSTHIPTVTGGSMRIIYLLPEGAMEWITD